MGGVYHITMLVSGEQEDAIRLLFRDKNWPCWIKVLSDDSVASLIHAGYLDMFPTMGEDYDLDNSTVYTEIKTEVVDVDNNAADNNDNNANSDNDDKNISKDIKPSFTDEDDNTMDYDMAQNKPNTDTDCIKEEASDEDSPPVTRGRKTRGRQTRNSKKSQIQNKSKSKTDNRLKCALCDTYCVNRTILKRHCRRRHKGQWLEFECEDCAKKFKTKEELWEHRRVANHKPRQVSSSTSKEVHTTEELIALGHLKCEICSNYYPHKRSLRRHMYKVHKDVLPKWSCAVCGEEFDSRDGLWKHKRQSEHKTSLWALGNYQCDSCGKIYNRYDSFREHKLSCKTDSKAEDESKDFPCDICGLVFKSMLRVKSHKRGVHVVAPVVCHVCGAMCKNKRALLVHRRRHDMKNKKFGCDDCGKTFFNNTLLTQHIRTHTKEKPYKCPMCNYRCAIKQNIHKHAMKVHKTTAKAVDLSGDLSKDEVSAVDTSGEYTEMGNTALDLSEDAHSTSLQDISYSEHSAKMFENESKSYENVAKSYEHQVKPYGIDSKSYGTETKPYTQDAKPYEQAPLPDIRFTMSELQKYNTGRRDVFGIDKMMDKDERELQALQSLGALSEGVHDLRSPSVRQAEMESRHPIDPNTSNIHHMPATSMSNSSKEKYLGVPYGSAYLNELQDLRMPSAIRSTDNTSDAGPKNYTMPPNLTNYPGISDMQFSPHGNETNPYKYNWGAPTMLSDDSVASLIHAGYLDMFPTMGEDYDLDNSTVYTEIKTEVVDVDNTAADNHDNNANCDNDDKNVSKDIKPSFTDEDDNTMDYDMAQDKPNTDPDCIKEEASDEDSPPVTRGRKTRARQTRNSKKSQNQNKSKNKTDNRLKCALCDTYCVNRTILKRHCRRRHKGQWLEFECKDCAKKFKTKEELWEHRRVANHKPRKVSTSTSKEVHTTEELIALGHLKCEICCNYYPHKRSLRRHMYKVHKDVLPKWSCAVCGEEFDSRDGLWKHKRQSEHKTSLWALGNYQCDSCGKIYNRYDSFREHKLSCKTDSKAEDESKDFPCDICGLVFKLMLRVKSHKRGVHVVAPVVCHVCGAMCKNKRALLVHRRRHDMKNKKFGCDDCGKTFFNNTLLTQHIRTHTKEKPYKCPMCNYRCAIKQNIHKHAMKVHKTTAKAVDLSGDLSKDEGSAVNTSGEYTEMGNTALDLSEEAHSTSMQDTSYSEHTAKMLESESKSYDSMAKSYENVAKSYENVAKSYEHQVKPYGIDSKSYETETKPYTQDAKPYDQAPLPDIRFTMSELQKYNTGRRDVFGIDKMMDKDERELQALQSLGALSEGVHDLRSPSVRQAEMESRHPIDPNTSNIHHMPVTSMSNSSKEKYLGVPYGSAYLNELQDLRMPSAIRSTDNAPDTGPKNYTMPPNLSNYPGISDMQFSPRGNETNPYKYNWGAPTSK